ncbi:MAG: 16S rRNA (adenine(1518)-N(6)/adenine(1519)-N(6))-dimethyltransferase RsmA [Oscillospiraceae bacterium]|nr:16S rRNA (adenine(1518)-N(6)/adenine(1519)-N(6))-dimethyltransferase RsmA [Oscillospiraceae bacterium]
MNFFHPQEIRAVLERHGFHFSKALGQNFLTQSWVPERMMTDSGVDKDCVVLEIGPGMGTLTQAIARYAEKVVAVELDHALIPVLAETLAEFSNVTVLEGDILKFDLSALCNEHFAGAKKKLVCANLPYYITTPILSYLLESRLFDGVCVMMQKEVALRLCAESGSADYGAFSVFTQYYAEPEILFSVPSSCFVPQPKVDSAIVYLKTRSAPPVPVTDEKLFFRVVRASFAQRRKKLANGLTSAFGDKERITRILEELGYQENVRGETLGIPDFAKIANKLAE